MSPTAMIMNLQTKIRFLPNQEWSEMACRDYLDSFGITSNRGSSVPMLGMPTRSMVPESIEGRCMLDLAECKLWSSPAWESMSKVWSLNPREKPLGLDRARSEYRSLNSVR